MNYLITVTALPHRDSCAGSDGYLVTHEELYEELEADVGQLIRVLALGAIAGGEAWPLPRDPEADEEA